MSAPFSQAPWVIVDVRRLFGGRRLTFSKCFLGLQSFPHKFYLPVPPPVSGAAGRAILWF